MNESTPNAQYPTPNGDGVKSPVAVEVVRLMICRWN